MSLADRAREAKEQKADNRCSIARKLDALDETERVAFWELVEEYSLNRLSPILRREGFSHDRDSLKAHLERECTCDPERSSE